MNQYQLNFTLQSDATFGSGDGVAGLIDREVAYDRFGLPYLKGRTLKGLLREEAHNILDSLQAIKGEPPDKWQNACHTLFGISTAEKRQQATVHYGRAQLPAAVRHTVQTTFDADDNELGKEQVMAALTAVRRQTAITPEGLPVEASLRTMRVVLRQTPFVSLLRSKEELKPVEEAFLAAVVLAWHRAGTGRNRGRGLLQADLLNSDGKSILQERYQTFVTEAAL